MNTHYTLLGIEPQANPDEIAAAYQRQRERYNPERVADLDDTLRQVAVERSAEIERAYAIVSDPARRRQYDVSIGITPAESGSARVNARRQISPRERIFAIVGVLVALALVAGIWVFTGRGSDVQSQAMGEVNRPAPAFSLQTVAGDNVSLTAYRGKVVLVNFWGTWCEPCKRELPALQAANERLGAKGLAIIGVNLTDDEKTQGVSEDGIRTFVAQYNLTYPIALDRDGSVTSAFRVFPLPTSFFIDVKGQIRYVHVGELTLDDVTARFTELQREGLALGAP
ncbi:MAG: redoxin domain-containing protein [Chloroflexales bacterium]|jgi:cytochrome c biogenesis protein CcmG, thiol:disulfide interchange protein DsbE